MPELSQINWVNVGIALVLLAIAWGIIQQVFKLTVRIFACGCAVLGGLVLAGAVMVYVLPALN